MGIYNCHAHVFTARAVPAHFLPFGLVRLLSWFPFTRGLARFLNNINPFSSDDLFDRYASFLETGSSPSQLRVFEKLREQYPEGTSFVLLMMDMAFMEAGPVRQSFEGQLDELARVKEKYPDTVFPFVAVDPRRRNVFDIVRRSIETRGFAGIKLYPPLGYYPFDERLSEVYAYAQENAIPIISHCSRGGVHYRGKITQDMLVHPRDPQWKIEKKRNSEFCDVFAHPRNCEYLLDDFPDLKICLAHFGGESDWGESLEPSLSFGPSQNWSDIIFDLVRTRRNVYTDVSCLMWDRRFHQRLLWVLRSPMVRKRVLFGTDFYMVETETNERDFYLGLWESLGDDNFRQITSTNPEQFLARKA